MKQAREDDTGARNRLILAATQVCAEKGFKAASVRKICERAGVNLAMVNYYFGSKDELYLAVIKRAGRDGFMESMLPASERAVPAAQRLGQLIEHLLLSLLSEGPESDVAKLITWELVEPSPALSNIVETLGRPMHDALRALVHEISPQALSEEQARLHAFSILGQVVFYSHSRPVNELLAPELRYDHAGIRTLAEHVTAFSLRGLGIH
jgi:AcrR family transcriptional regulator